MGILLDVGILIDILLSAAIGFSTHGLQTNTVFPLSTLLAQHFLPSRTTDCLVTKYT